MEKSFNEVWEKIHSTTEWGQYPSEHVIRFVARNYYKKERSQIKILDFGCGGGAHTWYLSREGFDTYAFDGSESAIARVQKKLDRENLKADIRVADALNCGYPSNYFDAIIDNACVYANVYNHIKTMYYSIYNMLKKDGKLLSMCFGKRTDGYGTGDEIEKDTYDNMEKGNLMGRGITHFFAIEELESILKEVGFKKVSIDVIMYTDNGSCVEQLVATAEK